MSVLVSATVLLRLRMSALAALLSSLLMSMPLAPVLSPSVMLLRVTLRTSILMVMSLLLIRLPTPLRLVHRWSWWRSRLSLGWRRWRFYYPLSDRRRNRNRGLLNYGSRFERRCWYPFGNLRRLWKELLIHQGCHNIKLIVIRMRLLRDLRRSI
jgi:hypothetical protein